MLSRLLRLILRKAKSLRTKPVESATDLLRNEFLLDFALFSDYAAFKTGTLYRNAEDVSDANLEALISIEYHRLEKGLSNANRRASFGVDAAERLCAALAVANSRNLITSITLYATEVLDSYRQVILGLPSDAIGVGWKTLSRSDIHAASSIPSIDFFSSRHSVRFFDSLNPPSLHQIREAINLASYTPSVCNRQSWRVMICESEHSRQVALGLQNGNTGFGHYASHVLIVASDRACFASIGERNQAWIEGGLFAMSLVYALHSLGLGTCCLNWSVDNCRDSELKQALDIPSSYAVAMMIAVGSLPEWIKVAESRRRSTNELIKIL